MEDCVFEQLTSFESLGVCPELLEGLKRLNYTRPTHIQAQSLPYTLAGRDIIGLAETGSGKTLSFALPILQALLQAPKPYFALVIAPTRELCLQINEHFKALGESLGLKSVVVVGGLDLMAQSVALVGQKPHVIVGTPGRVLHHLERTKGFLLDRLRYLVLDEADRLLDLNFEEALNKILEHLPRKRSTFLFSATMTNKVSKLHRASLSDPVKVEVSQSKHQTVSTLTQHYLFLPDKFKNAYLAHLLAGQSGKSAIVFTMTCKSAIVCCLLLRNLGFQAVPIHGQMSQVKRLSALSKFKARQTNLLVATDVASRGLDVPNVDLVVNYDVPLTPKDYVHRVGRTARAGKAGLALTLVTQYDVEAYQKIETAIGKRLDEFPLDEKTVLAGQERVQEAERIAEFEFKKLLEGSKKRKALFEEEGDEEEAEGKRPKKIKKKQFAKKRFDID